jgi:hypothetical protein
MTDDNILLALLASAFCMFVGLLFGFILGYVWRMEDERSDSPKTAPADTLPEGKGTA